MTYVKRLFESLSTTNDGAFVIDEHYRIVFWNQAAEAILGHTAKEVAGKQCYEILGGRDEQGRTFCQQYCRVAIQAARGDVLPNRDVYAKTQTGGGRWLNVTTFMYPSRAKHGDQIIVHLFRDATSEKSNQQLVDRVLAATSEQRLPENGNPPLTKSTTEPQTNGLTAREQQVLELLAQGLGTNEVAGRLVISPATVRNHVQNILSKFGAHSRLEAITYAYQQGLVEIDK
jgi:PAS domain S-box-containing protein